MKTNKSILYSLAAAFIAGQFSISAMAAEDSIDLRKIIPLYKRHCTTCHGDDGKGKTTGGEKSGVKDYSDPKVAEKLKETKKMAMSILKGLKDEEGKVKMAPFGRKLKPEEAVGLIKYLEHFSKKEEK